MDDPQFLRLKTIASMLLTNLMGAELDLLVYQTAVAALKQAGVTVPDMDRLLDEAREPESKLRAMVIQRYAETLQGLERFGQIDQDNKWLDALKSWKPEDPTN